MKKSLQILMLAVASMAALVSCAKETPGGSTVTKYDVKCAEVENGKISASATQAEAGTTITLTATPDKDYAFDKWGVINASTGETITVTDNKFTMPAANVNVSASFVKASKQIPYDFYRRIYDGEMGVLPPAEEYHVKAPKKEKDDYETQCFFSFKDVLPDGTKFHVKFEYKASSKQTVTTMCHNDPGTYIHSYCLGDINFTTEWQTFDQDATVPTECEGKFKSISFDLSKDEETEYFFRNIVITE